MTATASSPKLRVDTRGTNELPPHLDENLLTPRFYVTEFKKAAKTELKDVKSDFHHDIKHIIDQLKTLNEKVDNLKVQK